MRCLDIPITYSHSDFLAPTIPGRPQSGSTHNFISVLENATHCRRTNAHGDRTRRSVRYHRSNPGLEIGSRNRRTQRTNFPRASRTYGRRRRTNAPACIMFVWKAACREVKMSGVLSIYSFVAGKKRGVRLFDLLLLVAKTKHWVLFEKCTYRVFHKQSQKWACFRQL